MVLDQDPRPLSAAGHTPHLAADPSGDGPRRSLVLAGGGMRVAWQAGVLKALEEAGLGFHHADGTSGGTLSLAMLLSGLSPDEMCGRWRALRLRDFVSPLPLGAYLRGRLPGLAGADGLRRKVFPQLGIDVERIRAARGIEGTFNACEFETKLNRAIPHTDADLDLLVAGVSLPIMMPAVARSGSTWLDSVWVKDANLTEAVRRGSDELWLLWCIGNHGVYRDGPFQQYVHMIEMSAGGALAAELERIRELDHDVRLHVIRPSLPLPLDPDFFLGRIDAATLVAMGYRDAVRYLDGARPEGVPLTPDATRMDDPRPGVAFRERLRGPIEVRGAPGELVAHLSVEVEDLDRLHAGGSPAAAVVGDVSHPALGDRVLVHSGSARCAGAGRPRAVEYELSFAAASREWSMTISRDLGGDGLARLRAARTATAILREAGEAAEARGELTIAARDLPAVACSLHARGVGSMLEGARALGRFARFAARGRGPQRGRRSA